MGYINIMEKGNCKHIERKHKCILSCDICLKCHKDLLNKFDRVYEVVEDLGEELEEIFVTIGERFKNMKRILKGESH